MRGSWAILGWLVACAPPASGPGDGSSGELPTSSSGSTAGSTSSSGAGPATFGMDGAQGSEGGFVPPLDVACRPSAPGCELCDVREQSCIDGFKCAPWADDGGEAWTGTRCIEIPAEPVGPGEPCTIIDGPASGLDDCAPGSMCWGSDAAGDGGTCVPFCGPRGQRPECPIGTACMIDGPEVLALCLPPCDPLDSSPCPTLETCRYFSASSGAFCIPERGGRVLSPTIQCGSDDEACAGGEVCISAATFGGCGAPSCCTSWCDVADPRSDAECEQARPGHGCMPVFEPRSAPRGLEGLGFCAEEDTSR